MAGKNQYFSICGACFIAVFIAGVVCSNSAQRSAPEELYRSSLYTAVGGFTSGAEGPAADGAGNVYAVNFARQGTFGWVLPEGQSKVLWTCLTAASGMVSGLTPMETCSSLIIPIIIY